MNPPYKITTGPPYANYVNESTFWKTGINSPPSSIYHVKVMIMNVMTS